MRCSGCPVGSPRHDRVSRRAEYGHRDGLDDGRPARADSRKRGRARIPVKSYAFPITRCPRRAPGQMNAPIKLQTDDVRIREIKELAPPSHVLREYPTTEKSVETTFAARQAIHRILHGGDDRLLVVIGPCSIHDHEAAMDYARQLQRTRRAAEERSADRDARLFREAAYHGGLEGPDQRPAPRRQLHDQRGRARCAQAAVGDQRTRPAGGHRVPRHDHAAVHRRPDLLGRHRRAHHRIAGAPRTGLGPVLPGRFQERHRRQHPHRGRCDQGGGQPAPFPLGDQGRPLGDRVDHRQRGLPRHPARRQGAELRRRQRRRGVQGSRRGRACRSA